MVILKVTKKTATKSKGEKSHFFSQFTKSFKGKDDSINTLNFSVQEVSNDKYLKLYRIKSNLVDFNTDTLESSLNFTHEKEDLFLGINASVYETLKETMRINMSTFYQNLLLIKFIIVRI